MDRIKITSAQAGIIEIWDGSTEHGPVFEVAIEEVEHAIAENRKKFSPPEEEPTNERKPLDELTDDEHQAIQYALTHPLTMLFGLFIAGNRLMESIAERDRKIEKEMKEVDDRLGL